MFRRVCLLLMLLVTVAHAETLFVGVGIETYDEPTIQPLHYAIADVTALADAFRAAGVPERNVRLVTSEMQGALRPNSGGLVRALDWARIRARTGDTLVFYFSGHGLIVDGQSYLLTIETSTNAIARTAFPLAAVQEALAGFQGDQILLIIDACRTQPRKDKGGETVAMAEQWAKDVRLRSLPPQDSRAKVASLLACDVGQRAFEWQDEGISVFTYYLVQAMRGTQGALAEDGTVRVSSLAPYLLREVEGWCDRAKFPKQSPRLENPGEFDFLVCRPPRRGAVGDDPVVAPPARPTGPQINIQRREGTLVFETALPRVFIEVDGQPAGQAAVGAPLRQKRLIGTVRVRATAAGHVPFEQTVQVKLNETTKVELSPLVLPSLTVRTTVPGSTVSLDGVPRGAGPVTVKDLTPGPHTIAVTAPGRAPMQQTVNLTAGKEEALTLDAAPFPKLTIEVEQEGVNVELDGQPIGLLGPATPATIENLNPGAHRLKATKDGKTQEAALDLKPGQAETAIAWKKFVWPPAGWPDYLKGYQPIAGLQYRICEKDLMPQVLIPAGEFLMGSTEVEQNWAFEQAKLSMGDKAQRSWFSGEGPQQRVYVSAFWSDLHEVTNEQYCRFLNSRRPTETERKEWVSVVGEQRSDYLEPQIAARDGRYEPVSGQAQYPVIWVTWFGAQAYADWVGRALPTEAQWERAARGGRQTKYVWGDSDTPPAGAGNLCDETAVAKWSDWRAPGKYFAGYQDGCATTSPVCAFQPNAFGLHDLAGNVWEWCRDWYDEGWYAKMPARDPVNENKETYRVGRGGSWNYIPGGLRAGYRDRNTPGGRNGGLGFRCSASRP